MEPESLEEFHRFKGSVNPIYMGRMPSRMIGENLANDSKQDWNVEQQVRGPSMMTPSMVALSCSGTSRGC